MAKLKLIAEPTFKSKVGIPVPGGPDADVELVFKHRKKTDLQDFINSRSGKTDNETFFEMVIGWDLPDEFNETNANLLLENYPGAAIAVYRKYIDELMKARLGN